MRKLKQAVNNLPLSYQKYSLSKSQATSKHQSLNALNRLNLSLGDVRDVFEPYLAIFLASDRHWNQAQVGIALSTTSIAGIVAQTPVGALVDASQNKPVLVALATLAIAASYMVIVHFINLFAVIGTQAVIGVSAVIVAPAVAAISLGLVGQDRLRVRVGQNEAFNHTGNVGAAIIAGLLGRFIGRVWIFYFLMILCFAAIISVFQIRNRDIDNSQARGDNQENDHGQQRTTVKNLLSDRRLRIFASSVIIFYLANAALLPLVS
ncbi:MAG: MFS transporter [Rhizonema sp. PD38]|nr:MFS transporter [Rhizonema sp. PD38]